MVLYAVAPVFVLHTTIKNDHRQHGSADLL